MKDAATQSNPKPAVVSLAQLLAEQPAAPPPGWIEPGLLPPQGILFVGGEPKVGKSLLVANLALALAAGKDRSGFTIPAPPPRAGLPVRTAHAAVCFPPGVDAPIRGNGRRPKPVGG
ncbi:MAG TPA: AAA family ATPase, partial [Terracidiphilus sp.]